MTGARTSPPPPWLVKDLGEIDATYVEANKDTDTEASLNSASRTAITVATYSGVVVLCVLLGIWLRRYRRAWLDAVLLKAPGEDAIDSTRQRLEYSQSTEAHEQGPASLPVPATGPATATDPTPAAEAVAMSVDVPEGTEMQDGETRAVAFELSPEHRHSPSRRESAGAL